MSYGFWHLALQWSVPGETYDSYPASLTLLINFANVLVCKNSNCALVSAYEVDRVCQLLTNNPYVMAEPPDLWNCEIV